MDINPSNKGPDNLRWIGKTEAAAKHEFGIHAKNLLQSGKELTWFNLMTRTDLSIWHLVEACFNNNYDKFVENEFKLHKPTQQAPSPNKAEETLKTLSELKSKRTEILNNTKAILLKSIDLPQPNTVQQGGYLTTEKKINNLFLMRTQAAIFSDKEIEDNTMNFSKELIGVVLTDTKAEQVPEVAIKLKDNIVQLPDLSNLNKRTLNDYIDAKLPKPKNETVKPEDLIASSPSTKNTVSAKPTVLPTPTIVSQAKKPVTTQQNPLADSKELLDARRQVKNLEAKIEILHNDPIFKATKLDPKLREKRTAAVANYNALTNSLKEAREKLEQIEQK